MDQPKETNWKMLAVFFAGISLALAATIGIAFYVGQTEEPAEASQAEETAQPTKPATVTQQVWATRSEAITPREHFTVEAKGLRAFPFEVTRSMRNAYLKGTFKSTGGWRDDIRVTVMKERELDNFQRGLDTMLFYDSGRAVSREVEVGSLDPGTYVLVFDAGHAWTDTRSVSADIRLHYEILTRR